jgi:hypothetical protein
MRKHSLKVRIRAFKIWQKHGILPWKKADDKGRKGKGDFYRGAFDSIPFLNDDAKRTFAHLLLRPGYMIRDYIRGDHERYLAPLTSLIIFYAFFALVSAVLQPVQKENLNSFDSIIESNDFTVQIDSLESSMGDKIVKNIALLVMRGHTYLNLDRHPEEVKTRGESALAALEGTLRSQGIPLFLGQFFLLWLAMSIALRRQKLGMSATAAASAYILCQFSFFMLFAVLLTFGESASIGVLLMLLLLTVDLRQLLDVSWGKGVKLAVKTGIWYAVLFGTVILLIGVLVVAIAWIKSN